MAAPTSKVRELVYKRDGQKCVRCGVSENLSIQHRKAVGMGGSKRLPEPHELVTACMSCNARFESDLQQEALAHGWKIRQYANPLAVPVYYKYQGQWVMLTEGALILVHEDYAREKIQQAYGKETNGQN